MRPKLLEIEGLQSFRDVQIIDFEVLGETGLFGIFGITGSGKSTILDAITFALYGKVKRAGKGNPGIINTNMNSVNVSFTFEILKDGARKTYKVERSYRRKKGVDNSCEPKVVRLIEITENGEIPLSDKHSEVNGSIEELLGLNHEDFTRAVVLPQNSFQEFLLLDNSKKREMLERIFYLEEYGEQLKKKIMGKMSVLKSRLDILSGELRGYADATDQALDESKSALKEAIFRQKKAEEDLKLLEIKYNEAKEVWQHVKDLEAVAQKEAQYALLGEVIEQKTRFIDILGAKEEFDVVQEKMKALQNQLQNLNNKILCENKMIEDVTIQFAETERKIADFQAKIKTLSIAPEYRQKLQEGVILENEGKVIKENVSELKRQISELKNNILVLEQKFNVSREETFEHSKEIEGLLRELEKNTLHKLSKNLQKGVPCPVCGSLEHPNIVVQEKEEDVTFFEARIEAKFIEYGIVTELKVKKKNLEQLQNSLENANNSLNQKRQEYLNFLQKYKINGVAAELSRISEDDKKISLLQEQLEKTRQLLEQKRALLEEHKENIKKLNEEHVKIRADIENLNIQKIEKEHKLNELIKGGDIEAEIANINKKLKEYNAFKTNNASQEILTAWQDEIKEYEQERLNISAQKEILQKKLNSRSITDEKWNLIRESYNKAVSLKEECVSYSEVAKNKFNTLKLKNDKWKELHKEYTQLSNKYQLINQIQKLLNGDRGKDNSFIDYIAEERLRYVAAKASELLGEMTKYRYTLLLDANAGFIIRDNSNGGVHRMVSSLSGGETFLTSLSLALALSEQIQLKGQSPLEFFFLDEGFGTLDNNLLDLVIDSLERLSKKERVVGIISHVPELKSRISRRLIVEYSSFGACGSKVRIEKT